MVTFFLGLLWLAVLFVFRALITAFSWALWLMWPHWLVFSLAAVFAGSAAPAHAGWLGWLWGSDTRHLERSAELAQEAARVASEAAHAQAQQAAAQAAQNSRLAETLSQLSSERSNLADHLHALTEMGLRDSQWAAAITASGPLLICLTVLVVAGLALWLVNRSAASESVELSDTVDLLVGELSEPSAGPRGFFDARDGSLRLSPSREPALVGYAGAGDAAGNSSEPDDGPMPF
jgi:hypothetical protein